MAKRRKDYKPHLDPNAPPTDPRPFLKVSDWHIDAFFRRIIVPLTLQIEGLQKLREQFGPTNSYPYPERTDLFRIDRELERRQLAYPAAMARYHALKILNGESIDSDHWLNRIMVLKTERVGAQWLPAKGEVIAQPAPPPPPPAKEQDRKRSYPPPQLRPVVVCHEFA